MRARSVVTIVLLSLLLATPVLGAVGTAFFSPSSASPGTRVEVRIADSQGCHILNADALGMRLDRDFQLPPDAEVQLVRSGPPGTFSFVVPALAPGKYHVRLECPPDPDSWMDFGVGLEEGVTGFTVLPDTSTAPAGVSSGQHGAAGWISTLAGLLAFVLVVLVGARHRPTV